MSEKSDRGALIVPFAGPIYDALAPFTDLFLRLVLGLGFLVHGVGKIADPAAVAERLGNQGYILPDLMAGLIIFTEVPGAIMIVLGLYIRPAAAAAVIFMLVAVFVQKWDNGFLARGGFELDLVYLAVAIRLFVHGAGRYSIDERLSKTF